LITNNIPDIYHRADAAVLNILPCSHKRIIPCVVDRSLSPWGVDEEVEAVSDAGAEGVEVPDTAAVEVELTNGGAFSMYVPLG
jgi:hypothetical protein